MRIVALLLEGTTRALEIGTKGFEGRVVTELVTAGVLEASEGLFRKACAQVLTNFVCIL